MKLHHIAIWTFRLEELKEFYVRFLGGKSNEKYVNPKFGFWQQAKNASASSS
jgi:catechol 2,3-dioxygenase-like lactoylglutathione lyase family enzyme